MKRVLIHLRKSVKLIILLTIALLIAIGILYFLFRPMYIVKLNGEIIGYTDAKKQLEEEISDYMKSGNGEDIAFVEIDQMPEYEICYSKKDIKTNEEEHQVELREKYNQDNLFKKQEKEQHIEETTTTNETAMIEYKESIIKKIINKIKKIFHRNWTLKI